MGLAASTQLLPNQQNELINLLHKSGLISHFPNFEKLVPFGENVIKGSLIFHSHEI
jgi:hypothetical protein